MKPKWIFSLGAVVLVVWVMAGQFTTAAEVGRRAEAQTFMRLKMAWSQGVLEGLTLEKFDAVSMNAIRMRDMTRSNLWFAVRQPDYMARTTNFQQSVDALYLAAVDKNLDAATEAYLKVTRSCVECHRLVRADQRKQAVRGN